MRIGIDIDDTITNSWEFYMKFYPKIFDLSTKDMTKSVVYYNNVKDKYTRNEYQEMLKPLNDNQSIHIPLKNHVKEVIDKLYELGHSVVFITARNNDYTNPYIASKEYLDKHQIKYDKIIVRAIEKDKVCINENIDLFIDDSIRNCTSVAKTGIDVIMFDAPHNQKGKEFKRLSDWEEIYEYIKSR